MSEATKESSSGTVSISWGGVGLGVWWFIWGKYGFWWGVLYGAFWPVWGGWHLAAFLTGV